MKDREYTAIRKKIKRHLRRNFRAYKNNQYVRLRGKAALRLWLYVHHGWLYGVLRRVRKALGAGAMEGLV